MDSNTMRHWKAFWIKTWICVLPLLVDVSPNTHIPTYHRHTHTHPQTTATHTHSHTHSLTHTLTHTHTHRHTLTHTLRKAKPWPLKSNSGDRIKSQFTLHFVSHDSTRFHTRKLQLCFHGNKTAVSWSWIARVQLWRHQTSAVLFKCRNLDSHLSPVKRVVWCENAFRCERCESWALKLTAEKLVTKHTSENKTN